MDSKGPRGGTETAGRPACPLANGSQDRASTPTESRVLVGLVMVPSGRVDSAKTMYERCHRRCYRAPARQCSANDHLTRRSRFFLDWYLPTMGVYKIGIQVIPFLSEIIPVQISEA